ncbi:MAG: tetratricopeptide repeat protein [Selenomonadaceae bacterium]|nr:tetratricopeptide repeat protein [Selenomonadaceae bacterium]
MTALESKIYGHLVTLFNLYNLGDSYRKILCHATLLPLEGFDAATFIVNEDEEKILQLKNLESHSWIRRRKETNLLWIHPLIRMILKNELKPSDEDCADFLATLWNFFDNMYPQDLPLFKQASELFGNATNKLQDRRGDFAFYTGFCYMIIGNHAVASLHEERALKIRKNILPEDSPILARTYNDCGVAAFQMYHFNKGIEYLEQAIKILAQSNNIEDLQNMANVCANVAGAYIERGNSERGLIFAQKAIKIFEQYPPKNLQEKANAHNTLAQAFKSVKMYAESFEQAKISIDILEKIAPNNIPLAVAYLNIADTYALIEENEKALTLSKKALQIFEEKLPPNHGEISRTYMFISEIYESLGDTEAQNFYLQKFHSILYESQKKLAIEKLQFSLKILAENSPNTTPADLVKYNRDAADSYKFLNQLDEAQKFILESIKNILPTTAPMDKYLTYFSASQIFAASEKLDEAINFAQKSLEAAETLPDKFNVLSTPHLHLGGLYSKIGKHELALKNFLAALDAQQKLPEPEFSFVLLLKKAVGREFLALKNFAQAEKIFSEVLSEQLKILPEFHSDVQITKKLLNFAQNKISMTP